ncbi:MAG: polysaccharide deacetylase family protein [Planctomycetota bacterium]
MRSRLLVLMYHGVFRAAEDISACDAEARKYAVTADALREHIASLRRAGGAFVSAGAAFDLKGGNNGAKAGCLLTFDDSCRTHYTDALPVLEESGLSALFFVTVGEIGQNGCLSWRQLRQMCEAGMSIQSHGRSHRFMTLMERRELHDELVRSRRLLEDKLGAPVRALSVPGGRYDAGVLSAARRAGYEYVFCSDVGTNRAGRLPFLVKRLPVTGGTGADFLARAIRRPLSGLLGRALRWRALCLARGALGEDLYARVTGRLPEQKKSDLFKNGNVFAEIVEEKKRVKRGGKQS